MMRSSTLFNVTQRITFRLLRLLQLELKLQVERMSNLPLWESPHKQHRSIIGLSQRIKQPAKQQAIMLKRVVVSYCPLAIPLMQMATQHMSNRIEMLHCLEVLARHEVVFKQRILFWHTIQMRQQRRYESI